MNNKLKQYQMKLNEKEIEAIKELIYREIDLKCGIENIDPDLNTLLWKINNHPTN